ncbi:hypothetical protein KUW19_17980 [Ferrimonas balearica]|uniref:hypothetical protein n=1 Tax=Ferrimonas balearica TaxID=44012 RepID=UPI001C96C56C|nr:hypothetical protein [Ferrimonas balearica]MBY6108355.1 hypothetical protein [Ferrimonas balearica]
MMKRSLIALALCLPAIGAGAAEYEVDFGYDSKYISQGRDNLDQGGIYWASGAAGFDNGIVLSAAYGYAADSDVDYDELNLGIEYGFELGDFAFYGSYTRLEFFKDDEADNEFGAGVAYGGLSWFEPFIDYVYSTESEGSFVEIGVQRAFALNERLALTPYVIAGLDYGYANPDHDGENHLAVGATLGYQLTEQLGLTLIAEHTEAHRQMAKDEGIETDQTWAGIHLTMAF